MAGAAGEVSKNRVCDKIMKNTGFKLPLYDIWIEYY
jgi:hypothetical protein